MIKINKVTVLIECMLGVNYHPCIMLLQSQTDVMCRFLGDSMKKYALGFGFLIIFFAVHISKM